MTKPVVTKRTVHWEGMCWPRYLEPEDDSVQWRLRYGAPTKADLLFAASVMQAYGSLVASSMKVRQEIVSVLRNAEHQIVR